MNRKDYGIHKTDNLIFLAGIIGLVTVVFLYPKLSPETAIRTEYSSKEIMDQSKQFVDSLGYSLDHYNQNLNLDYKRTQLQYLNQTFGSSKTNRLIRDSVSVFYYSFMRSSKKAINIEFEENKEKDTPSRDSGAILLMVDLKGRPIYFEFQPETAEEPGAALSGSADEEADREIAEGLAQKLFRIHGGAWDFENKNVISDRMGKIFQYRWNQREKVANESIQISIDVQNGRVKKFEKEYILPESFVMKEESNTADDVSIVILFLFAFILGVIYFIQRLRLDLMDLKTGILPGIIVLIGWSCIFGLRSVITSDDPLWEILLGYLLTVPFIVGGMWALFTMGESLTREVWPKKLETLDSLRKKILTPHLGLGLFRGLALLGICAGTICLLNYASIHFLNGYYNLGESPLYFWSSRWPSLTAVGKSSLSAFYIVVTYCLFLITLLRRKIKSSVIVILLAALIWSISRFPMPQVLPFALRSGVNGLAGLIFVLFLFRYDFFTVATGAVGLPILHYGIVSVFTGNAFYTLHGAILLGIILIALIIAFIACRSEPVSEEAVHYVPDYLQRIYERERVKKELEIARNVQLHFLPRTTPQVQGMDIASICIPAEEVGGDYYDFIRLGDKKLGVLIGDVSGKGISAAIYMTLTKGLFQSRARDLFSPKEVLVHMNESFYANAERGIFISMIYCIFDLDAMKCTYARAGHNPMILWRASKKMADELCPPGIALGLEPGQIFNETIQEESARLEKGDTLLFYTDGLNEAQNRFQEEFGEDKLKKILVRFGNLSSKEILEKMQEEIEQFTFKAPQHDDMTAVLIKIA
jgi:sigma-B regulation protein RsbU (phosphoserine phosphatase)